ncbi:hypothetical protein BpHYR1_038654 [Brachionus plicatilis]|uniref:Uncharacterized protein n=1 Tax=Brachionus plicatilis TaxID=10195 RepID=A0A3M7RKK0_BRAPC|nr:hypothetical protein BpHYR1_038654 [Brachionus plicatilis]
MISYAHLLTKDLFTKELYPYKDIGIFRKLKKSSGQGQIVSIYFKNFSMATFFICAYKAYDFGSRIMKLLDLSDFTRSYVKLTRKLVITLKIKYLEFKI